MFGEDSFLDSYMEDYISAGYANPYPMYGDDPYYSSEREEEPWSEWDEDEFERGFNEAHARSEEEDYHRYFGYE